MRNLIKTTLLAGLLFAVSTSAGAISRDDLIDCLRGQQPEGVVCPIM